jgi:hypothetical protein
MRGAIPQPPIRLYIVVLSLSTGTTLPSTFTYSEPRTVAVSPCQERTVPSFKPRPQLS